MFFAVEAGCDRIRPARAAVSPVFAATGLPVSRVMSPQSDANKLTPLWTNPVLLLVAASGVFVATLLALTGSVLVLGTLIEHLLTDGVLLVAWLLAAWGWGWLALRAIRIPDGAAKSLTPVTSVATGIGCIGLAVLGLGLLGFVNRIAAIAAFAPGLRATSIAILIRMKRVDIANWRVDRWHWLFLIVVPACQSRSPARCSRPESSGATSRTGTTCSSITCRSLASGSSSAGLCRSNTTCSRTSRSAWRCTSCWRWSCTTTRAAPMFLAQLMHLAMMALSVVAVYGIVREHASTASATVAATVAGATPWLLLLAPVAYVEGGLLLFGTLATGWFLHALRNDSNTPWRAAIVAGVFAGLACGTKLTAVPMIVVILPLAAAIAQPRQLLRVVSRSSAYLAIAIITFSPWLIRTAVWSGGNPVFPEATAIFGKAHWSEVQVEALATREPSADGCTHRSAARSEILTDARFGYILLPLSLVAAIIVWRRPESRTLLITMVLMLIFWVAFTHLQSRFCVVAIPIAAMLIGHLNRFVGGRIRRRHRGSGREHRDNEAEDFGSTADDADWTGGPVDDRRFLRDRSLSSTRVGTPRT